MNLQFKVTIPHTMITYFTCDYVKVVDDVCSFSCQFLEDKDEVGDTILQMACCKHNRFHELSVNFGYNIFQ